MILRSLALAVACWAVSQAEQVDTDTLTAPGKGNTTHHKKHKDHKKHDTRNEAATAVKIGTPPDAIALISPSTATKHVERVITFESSAGIPVSGGKVTFVPAHYGCNSVTPSIELSTNGTGTFLIDHEPGKMKLCYQAPGLTDSVEQPSSQAVLTLYQLKSVPDDLITEIFPKKVTVNVKTDIKFTGAEKGDSAFFIREGSGATCTSELPTTHVGTGHNLFTLTSPGTYKLCYKVLGAQVSAEQKTVKLEVISPGDLTKDMLDSWTSKQGTLDCSPFQRVSQCGVHATKPECEKSYRVQSGRGYKCFWKTSVFPDRCSDNLASVDKPTICQAGTCGGAPEMCWIGPH